MKQLQRKTNFCSNTVNMLLSFFDTLMDKTGAINSGKVKN
jgi:hypothetical protein